MVGAHANQFLVVCRFPEYRRPVVDNFRGQNVQVNIDRRYDEDDPEIEKKVRETDENCVRSEGMELQTEHFAGTYPIDLMPSQVRGEELK